MSDRAFTADRRPFTRLASAVTTVTLVLASCVTGLLTASPAHAAYPGANGKIYFLYNEDIYGVDADGTNPVQLTNTPAAERELSVSADGLKIVFLRCSSTSADVYSMNADGTGVTQLTTGSSATCMGLDISPDGTKIAYTFNGGIKVINADGTNPVTLITGNAYSPDYSPDGTKIAYGLTKDIYTINTDGTGQNKLTVNPPTWSDTSSHPEWSPDGTKIVYMHSQPGPPPLIYVMNAADGSNKTWISAGTLRAVWSPDGTQILCQGNRLITMSPDGSNSATLAPPTGSRLGDWAAATSPSTPSP
ncbi:TolB family protein [Streptosporangium sp. NPDC000095]|uniref:TolB family protein n=1 Tax=Streptosporangium sp. NPDC000095 TaxID=3366184 RepID=UPI0036C11828